MTNRAATNHFKNVYTASFETFFSKEDEYLTEDDQTETESINLNIDQELEFSGRKRPKDKNEGNQKAKIAKMNIREMDEDEEMNDEEDMKKHSIQNVDLKLMMAQINLINKKMELRWTMDLIVSAGTKEDIDKIENNLNMNKVVVMGLDVPDLWDEEDWKHRVAKLKDAVADLFNFINPGVDYKLNYVKHLISKIKAARQIVEVTLESERNGKSIQKAYAERIKEWRQKKLFLDQMAGVSITPALTLATRVRIAMLKAMATVIKEEFEDTETWVIQHVARLVLKVEQTENGKKTLTSYGFAQTMAFFLKELPQSRLTDQLLFDAYTIAGTRFGPEISHHFVVLEVDTAEKISKQRNKKRKQPKTK